MTNNLVIAGAGSGKTTYLVQKALEQKTGRVLITTFTEANEEGIRQKFIEKNQCVPENVTIQTWFSFLLQHGARPYQGKVFDAEIMGLILENGQSARGTKERETAKHYFTTTQKIYSDKLSKFVLRCNNESNGEVIQRICRIYSHIFIDEVQDLAGYDLELLKAFFASSAEILLVGDPRQGTYSTNNASKNSKFRKSEITHFFEDHTIEITTIEDLLTTNYRCIEPICNFSNRLYEQSSYKPSSSGNNKRTGHDGIFLVRPSDVNTYLEAFRPMQLRDSIRTKGINEDYEVTSFGKSKGLEFERVLIYPTEPIMNWLVDNNFALAATSRSRFYVALTRAKYSVGIVSDQCETLVPEGIQVFKPLQM